MNYKQQLEWLFTQFPSYQKVGKRAYKPGIETMTRFDTVLGMPHHCFRTIHVAGTNGKGSVSHMLASALAANNLKVGLYTSPHLIDFRERIKIIEKNSYKMISKEAVSDFMVKWKHFFEEEKPSFFEITTAMAFDYFREKKVDIAVIETGLGGRLDSTNVITPILSVITNIGLEHCEHLGYTLEEIAFEKGGIIKPGVPVVIGEALPETKPVFEKIAADRGSRIVFAEDLKEPLHGITYHDLDLLGDYQQKNLNTLFAVLNILREGLLRLDSNQLIDGICHAAANTALHGRWETLSNEPGKARIICDTGHNAHGIRWVREQIDKISCDYDHIFMIFGVVADKDIDAIAHYLPHDVHYIFTNADSPRALPAAKLAGILSDYGITGHVSTSVQEALDMAGQQAEASDLIFIGGSNFVVAEVLERFI